MSPFGRERDVSLRLLQATSALETGRHLSAGTAKNPSFLSKQGILSSFPRWNMTSPIDVNEEYRNAMRARSYLKISTKFHSRESTHNLKYVQKPKDYAILVAAVPDSNLQALLTDFFVAGELACNICVTLLSSVRKLRRNHLTLQSTLDQTEFNDLAHFASLENPLSAVNFKEVHTLYETFLRKLSLTRDIFAHRARRLSRARRAYDATLSATALAAARLTAQSANPALILTLAELLQEKRTILRCGHPGRMLAQTEAAARAAYIVNKDMETVSRMAAKVEGEVEHRKRVVVLFLRCRQRWLLAEAVGGGGEHLERVGELEEHVYWCLLTIKKTWALLAKEIVIGACGL